MSICVIFARIVFKTLLGGAPHRTLADGFVAGTKFLRVFDDMVSKVLQRARQSAIKKRDEAIVAPFITDLQALLGK